MINSAEPWLSTGAAIKSETSPKSFPDHSSLHLQEFEPNFLPGSAWARSEIFTDITVFALFRLKKATYTSPKLDQNVIQ